MKSTFTFWFGGNVRPIVARYVKLGMVRDNYKCYMTHVCFFRAFFITFKYWKSY